MPRPSFSLTDDQARMLAASVAELRAAYPVDPRNHRPFVRGFLRAVRSVTGQLYSPAIYHRLLSAYAPERRPSSDTLAREKAVLAGEPHSPTRSADIDSGAAATSGPSLDELYGVVAEVVDGALARARRLDAGGTAQLGFYADRLREAERERSAARVEAAGLAAALAAAQQDAVQHLTDAAQSRETLAAQAHSMAQLTAEVSEIRKFALQAIDEARGETRLWKERASQLEAQRQSDAKLLEVFRRQAYAAGADIPDALKSGKRR